MKIIHMMTSAILVGTLSTLCLGADEWPRFRGPDGTGIAAGKEPLPAEIGPQANLLWKTSVANGISSPVIAGGRVYLTTAEAGPRLSTVALDAQDGRVLWRASTPIVHKTKGKRLASTTPVTDGERVISFFGSSGLLCYDRDGKLQWKKEFGPLKNQFNHAASPILVNDRVILVVDHDGDSFVVALDNRTGKELWRCYRFVLGRNYASPIVWKIADRNFIVVTGSGLITGYEIETGKAAWYVRGTAAVVNPTPIVGGNGWLYIHGSSPSSGAKSSPFRSLLTRYDRNRDSALQAAELPNSFLKAFYKRFDSDGNGGINEEEYLQFKQLSRPFVKGMVALKPAIVKGQIAFRRVWTQTRSMPRTPSALYHNGVLYVVSEKGILHSLDPESGKVFHKGRIAARGTIYSSPSLGDGKIYIGTRSGAVAVIAARAQWKNLHSAKLDGEIQASPAIANGRVYFRTDQSLYCFGLGKQPAKKGK